MPEAVIVSTARSPIGRAFKGSLAEMRPGLTKTVAVELGPFGVTANAVAPGFIVTEHRHRE